MKFFFKSVLPSPEKLNTHWILRWLLAKIGNAYIWQINRRSIAGGVASGLFFGSLPIPIQIPCAVLIAIFFRLNAPVAVFSTLFSNPFTMPAIFYGNYRIGCWIFYDCEYVSLSELSFAVRNLKALSGQVLMPLFSGSVLVGTILALIGYFIVYFLWKWQLVQHLNKRKSFHQALDMQRTQRKIKHNRLK